MKTLNSPSFLPERFLPSYGDFKNNPTIKKGHIIRLLHTIFKLLCFNKVLKFLVLFTFRSSHSQMFFKIGVLKNFPIFTEKHLCWRTPPVVASVLNYLFSLIYYAHPKITLLNFFIVVGSKNKFLIVTGVILPYKFLYNFRRHSFSTYAKSSEKTNISYPLIRKRTY